MTGDEGQVTDVAVQWVAVACVVADVIRAHDKVAPSSSKTDLFGTYGQPEVYTEWSVVYPSGREMPLLREHRWPGPEGGPDAKPCEHYAPTNMPVLHGGAPDA